MFEQRHRRHPVQTFQFWFVVLISFGAVTAWKLELFPQAEHVHSRLPDITDEPMPPPPRALAQKIEATPISPPAQSEEAASAAISSESEVVPAVAEQAPAMLEAMQRNIVRTAYVRQPVEEREATTAKVEVAAAKVPAPVETISAEQLQEIDRLIQTGDDVAALRQLSGWYWKASAQRPQFIERLKLVSGRVYFQPQPHYLAPHVMQFGERLETVSAQYQLSPEYLTRLNRIDPKQIRTGQSLKVLQGPFSAVVDMTRMELTVHTRGYYIACLPIGAGMDASIPSGTFQVTEKVLNPHYFGSEGNIGPDDPANPLGTRWLTINDANGSLKGFGLHGTNDSSLIGQTAAQGCIRLGRREVEGLYDLLVIGSEVIIKP